MRLGRLHIDWLKHDSGREFWKFVTNTPFSLCGFYIGSLQVCWERRD